MLGMNEEPVRLAKLMAQRGMCSRREAEAFIEKGWVLVDGQPVTTQGTKILPSQTISLAPVAQQTQQSWASMMLNKPVGYVSGQPEDDYPAAVVLLTPENHWAPPEARLKRVQFWEGLAPAGRLDIDSRGLIIFTQDGRLAKLLTSDNSEVEKEYHVRVIGDITPVKLARLRHGLVLDGRPLRFAEVEPLGPDRLKFILREGRNRQVRWMCELVDLRVVGLMRVRIGNLRLGELPEGCWRYIRPEEIGG